MSVRRELVVIDGGDALVPLDPLTDHAEQMFWKQRLSELSGAPLGRFPGKNPVSLERSQLKELANSRHVVSLKLDGVRYLLMLSNDAMGNPCAIMFDRSLSMHEIEVWANHEYFTLGTLLDGELVRDFSSESSRFAYMAFDALLVCGERCRGAYSDRLQILNQIFLSNTEHSIDIETIISEEKRICAMHNPNDLRLFAKKFMPAEKIAQLWREGMHSPFRHDGVIITSEVCNEHSARSFKWKLDHTIDVLARLDAGGQWRVSVGFPGNWQDISESIPVSFDDDTCKRKERLSVQFEHNELVQCLASRGLTECVMECACSLDNNSVRLFAIKVRTDKSTPNSLYVVQKTLLNIRENITIDDLVSAFAPAVCAAD